MAFSENRLLEVKCWSSWPASSGGAVWFSWSRHLDWAKPSKKNQVFGGSMRGKKKQQVANCGFRICKVWFFFKEMMVLVKDLEGTFLRKYDLCRRRRPFWGYYRLLQGMKSIQHAWRCNSMLTPWGWKVVCCWSLDRFFLVFAAVAHNLRALREVDLT